ncbi:DUF1102 domain-containing protein [Halorubrum kocurii]|uniref:DUF1102 domain-containing protein n=1 Tax=Halorubrum kocurii TaxID=478441 RepID=UPI0009B5A30D|nr:DUF1102 domain-containing protein [Halorubrum kocurii]
MQRRKMLAGLGSLAAGGAAAMGTGAFNFANIERGMNVNVTDDSSAFLALNDTSAYADGSGDKLALTFDSDATVTGDGINKDSDYSFTGVFSIRNQGNQPVKVWIVDDDGNDAVEWYGTDTNNKSDFSTLMEDPGNTYQLDIGERVFVNVVIFLKDNSAGDLPTTIEVVADESGA